MSEKGVGPEWRLTGGHVFRHTVCGLDEKFDDVDTHICPGVHPGPYQPDTRFTKEQSVMTDKGDESEDTYEVTYFISANELGMTSPLIETMSHCADRYDVDDGGDLTLYLGNRPIATYPAWAWVRIVVPNLATIMDLPRESSGGDNHVYVPPAEKVLALAEAIAIAFGHAGFIHEGRFSPGSNTMRLASEVYDRLASSGWVVTKKDAHG